MVTACGATRVRDDFLMLSLVASHRQGGVVRMERDDLPVSRPSPAGAGGF